MSPDQISVEQAAPTPSHRVYRLLHDIYVLLDASDRNLMRQYNLTPSQYTLLTLLSSNDGQHLTTLSERLFVARSTITRLINQLEAAGLVHRVSDSQDRRIQRVVPTSAGLDLLRHAYTAHEESLKKQLSDLPDSEQETLSFLLLKLRSSLRRNLGIAEIDV